MRTPRCLAGIVSILTLVLLAACTTQTAGSVADKPNGGSKQVTKLLVFVVENHSLGQMRGEMPYTFSLAQRYAHATRYFGVAHPSLPNYLAMVGGKTFGVTDNHPPQDNPVIGTSIFSAALRHGHTAKVYAEGMPATCTTANGGDRYVVRHNPWPYFVKQRKGCRAHDVSLAGFADDVAKGRLPNVGMVVPNVCNDAHNCALALADDWFHARMTSIFAGPDWKAGRLAVVLTADEDDKHHGNRVLTVVIHRSQHHRVVKTRLDHYSLAGLYADVLGVPRPGAAKTGPSMAAAFHLPVG
jgi:hypothetical protein